MPKGVREVVGRRLGRLGAHAHPVLELAAVAGLQLDVAGLASAHHVPPDELLVALAHAATTGGLSSRSTTPPPGDSCATGPSGVTGLLTLSSARPSTTGCRSPGGSD